jgi:hypothetical protein
MPGKLIGLVQPSNQNLNGAWPGKEINQTHNFFLNCTSWNLVLLDLSTQPGCGMEAKYALSFDRLPFSLSPARQTRLFVEVRFKHLGRGILAHPNGTDPICRYRTPLFEAGICHFS